MYQFMPTSPTINIIAVPDIQMPCGRSCKHPLFRLHGACLKHFIVYKSRHLYPFPRICQKIIILPDGKKINACRDFLSHPTTDFRKFFIGQQKGQKTPLENSGKLTSIKACLGWNVKNPACDVDVSAFLLGSSGKVIGDSWFVFYGQTESPDHSTVFHADGGADREIISVDFTRLDPSVARIVFVLTINEAFEKNLNFGMLEDAYIRIMDPAGTELVSFKMDEYYTNVTSMMIGELYLHNGAWKFNAIGNGVAKDLAGLCGLYGVQVI